MHIIYLAFDEKYVAIRDIIAASAKVITHVMNTKITREPECDKWCK